MNTDDIKDAPFNQVAFMVERGHRVRREVGIPVGVSWNLGILAVASIYVDAAKRHIRPCPDRRRGGRK